MNFIRRHRRPFIVTALIALFLVVAVFAPQSLRAETGPISGMLANWLSGLLYFFLQMAANLLVVVINIMVAIAQYNNFLGSPAVEKGWVIVRDLSNMFFIVVLLIIAFGTILKLENYRYNRLLARLIVMAVLVNFSKFIAGFFIDFAQVIMLTFVNAWRDAAAGNITYALGLQDIVGLADTGPLNLNTASVDAGAVLTAVALGLILVVIAVIVMTIIAIVLLLRILALWFLIVLSPLAYLLRTYPSTEKYAGRWWQEFGRYVVVGPVVGFLLWLSLAIMAQPSSFSADVFVKVKTSESSGIGQRPSGETDPLAADITATITKIGQSERLLSYMMGIMLLVGTLVITKELGVAGGQLAGQWADKIKGFATKAATVGGATMAFGVPGLAAATLGKPTLKLAKKGGIAAAKGIGGAALDWAERKTGFNLRPKEWIEGFQRGGKRRHDRSRETVYRKALDRWRGTTREVAIKKWAFGKKKMLGFIPRPSREVVGTREKKEWHPILAMGAMPEFARVNLLTPGGLMAAAGGRFRKYREATNQQERGKQELEDMIRNLEAASNLERPEQYATERHANEYLPGEIERRRMAGDESANYRVTKNEKGEEIREFIDDVMRAQGIDVHVDPATDERKRRFLKQWDQDRAAEMPPEERERILEVGRNQYRATTDEAARVQEGQRLLREDATRRKQEAAEYTGDGARLTAESAKVKNDQLEEIKKLLAKIDGDIKKKQAAGADATDLITRRDEMRKQADYLAKYLSAGKATEDKDRVASETNAKKLSREAERLEQSAVRSITDTELAMMRERTDRKGEQVRLQGEEVSKYRLPTPFELYNEFRGAINEKKKQLLTDDWHEHLAVFEDAIRNHDASLAAAALQRAAEYANENELMNGAGYDYSKGDFRSFIEDIFMKQLKLSKEQALAIATDVSFIAEKNGHYNIMRSTTVDPATGHREWQDEDDQVAEIVAEMGKMDKENIARRTNRLGYGDEIVGYAAGIRPPAQDAPESEWRAYREKKAAHFRSGGSREFMLAPNGAAYIAANYATSFRSLGQGRFNDSFAIRATEPANEKMLNVLREMLRGVQRPDPEKAGVFRTIEHYIKELQNFAGSKTRADINYVEEALRRVKKLEE